jgi:hypothetical protein
MEKVGKEDLATPEGRELGEEKDLWGITSGRFEVEHLLLQSEVQSEGRDKGDDSKCASLVVGWTNQDTTGR